MARQLGAFAAGRGADRPLAVQRLDENPGDGGLADPAGAGEQERVVELAGIQRIFQRAHDVPLPRHIGKGPGTPFSGEREVGHGRPESKE